MLPIVPCFDDSPDELWGCIFKARGHTGSSKFLSHWHYYNRLCTGQTVVNPRNHLEKYKTTHLGQKPLPQRHRKWSESQKMFRNLFAINQSFHVLSGASWANATTEGIYRYCWVLINPATVHLLFIHK